MVVVAAAAMAMVVAVVAVVVAVVLLVLRGAERSGCIWAFGCIWLWMDLGNLPPNHFSPGVEWTPPGMDAAA